MHSVSTSQFSNVSIGFKKAINRWVMIMIIVVSAMFSSLGSFAQFAVTTNGGSGLAPTYTSLANAISALNGATITSPVVITCPTGTETAPAGGYSITATGTAVNTITIEGNGAANSIITASAAHVAGALTDAIIKLVGSDFITIQGFRLQESANTTTTAATNNMTEWGIALLYATATNGAQDVTIQNNTITLNKVYQNSFGIYSNSTHNGTSVSVTNTATGTTGGNHNLKVYSNTISNVNNGIVVVGPSGAADYNTGIDIGGSSALTANTISNFGTTGTFSSYVNLSGSIYGVLVRHAIGFNVSFNSITCPGNTAGTLRGIYVPAFIAAPTTAYTNNINNNTISLTYGVATGTLVGIANETTTGSALSSININNNNFTALSGSIATSAATSAIIDAMAHLVNNINNNTLTNITTNTTGSFTFISNTYALPAGGTENINNNAIVTGFNKTGAGGTVTMISSSGTSTTATAVSHSNNNFSNITVTGATVLNGITNAAGGSGILYGRTVNGNTFSNWTGGTSAISCMSYTSVGGSGTIASNTISNIAGQGAITGITITSTGNAANPLNISGNTISGLVSSGVGGTTQGVFISSNTSPLINIDNNTISGISSTSLNNLNGIQTVSTGSLTQTVNIFKNKICDLVNNGVMVGQWATGMFVTGSGTGTTVNVYNNLVSDVRAPNGTGQNNVNGLTFNSSAGTINISHNTVYLNATMSGGGGANALYSNTGSTQTVRNNIFVNESTVASPGLAVGYRRAGASLLTYGSASNNNLYWVGTTGGNRTVFNDGTTNSFSLSDFKTLVGPTRDASTVYAQPNFLVTNCGNPNFLRIDPTIASLVESGGTPVAGITDDIDGNTRNVSTPDIGADEFNGIAFVLHTINSVSINPTGNACVSSARTVTANVTIGDNPVTSITLSYSLNGGAAVPVTMTGGTNTANATSNWTATIPAAIPSNAIVTWSVIVVEPLITKTMAGTSYGDDPLSGGSISISGTPNPVCAGSPIAMTATTFLPGANVTLGAGASTSTTYSAPFYSLYSNKHYQTLIRKAELTAAGLGAGDITALTLFTTVIDGVDLNQDFSIKMGNTAVADLSTALVSSGLVPVFATPTFSPIVGANTITFSAPFNWDGTSNIVVEICFGNNTNTNTLSSTMLMDVTSYVSVREEHTTTAGGTSGTVICSTIGSAAPTTYSLRPKITLKGFGVVPLSSYSWTDGISNVGTGISISPSPLATTTYTVTGTDVNGCTIASAGYLVNTLTGPTPPNGNNSTQCGTAFPTAFVISNIGGNGTGFRWYDAQLGGTLLQTGGGLYTTAVVSSTTTFWVAETDGTCESLRTPVTVTVTLPDAVDALVDNNNVCLNTAISLSATKAPGTNTYTYAWTASPLSGSGLSGSTAGNPLPVTPTAPGTYTYTVTATDNDCVTTDFVTVIVKALPVVNTTTATPAAVCSGLSSTLTAFIGSAPAVSTIGTQTTTLGGTTGSPYRSGAGVGSQVKGQYLIKASELTSAGLLTGSIITSIGYTTTTTTGTNTGMEIYMAHTAATVMTTSFLPAPNLVFTAATFTPVPNITNTHNLSTSFVWNGTDNIVVEMRHVNSVGGTSTATAYTPGYTATIQQTGTTAYASLTGLTSVTRPLISFGFFNNSTASYNWLWNPGALSGSSVSVSPTTTTTYTATATDPTTTCSGSLPVTLTIYELPAAPSGVNSDQCGTLVPAASVSSNSSPLPPTPIFKWYSAAIGGTLLQTGTFTTYQTAISVTTDFYVSELNANGCEGPRTQVTATVGEADPVSAASSLTSICPNTAITLSATQTGSTNTFVYTWTANPVSGSGIPTEEVGNPVIITPTASGTYTYTVTAFDVDKGCTSTSTVVVTVNAVPLISGASATPATVCSGATSTLSAVSIPAAAGTVSVGTGATTATSYNSAFYSLWSNKHEQIMIRASELNAAGLVAGNITALSFPTTVGTLSPVDFRIQMAQTAATTMSSFITTGLTQVYFLAVQPQVVNTNNTLILNTPYNWDGTSNLVIDICFGNAGSSATLSSTAPADATSYVSVIKTNTNAATSATISCPDLTTNLLTYSVRPRILIGGQVGVNNTANFNWVWNPGNINAGTTGIATVNPLTTTTYTATATNGFGCSTNADPVTVTTLALPNPPVANPSTQCGFGIPTASVSTGGSNGTYKWYDAQTAGTLLQTGGSTYTTAISSTTSFWVSETDATCESVRTEVVVTVTQPDAITAVVDNNSVCLNSTIQLSNTQTGSTNTYTYTWSANPAVGSGMPTSVGGSPVSVTPTAAGTYTYTITGVDASGPNTCTINSTVVVTINPLPVVSSVTATPGTICSGGNAVLEAKSLIGSPLSIKIGTGLTGFTGAANPYWRSGESSKNQMLYRASDLISAGFTAGPINGISFFVTSSPAPGIYFQDYTISLLHTNLTAITTTIEPGGQQVFGPATFDVTAGTNTHLFNTPFVWDGVSNIIVQTCYNNDFNNSCTTCAGSTPAVEYTASVGYNASSYIYGTNSASSTWDFCVGNLTSTGNATQANLPNATFIRTFTNNTSLYNWSWASTPAGTYNTAAIITVNPTTTTTYTPTATDPVAGCVTVGTSVTVNVNPTPLAPVTNGPITQCGAGPIAMTAANTGGTMNWYTTANGLVPVATGNSYTPSVLSSTSYWVAETYATGNCEGPRTEVVIIINTAPILAITAAGPTTYCAGGSVNLDASILPTDPSYVNFTWSPGTGLNTTTGAQVTANPTTTTTYTLTANDGVPLTGCSNVTTVTVTVNPNPNITAATANLATICIGGSSTLSAVSIPAAAGTVSVGTGATTATSYNSAFYSLWSNKHEQIMIRASELNAAGLVAGNITALSFPTTVGTLSPVDFRIQMAQTAATTMSSFITTGLTQVYFLAVQPQVVNTNNTLTLNTPYNWDGTSNLVIDICFGNAGSSSTLSSTAPADATSYVSVIKTNTNAATSATISCPDLTTNLLTYSVRPRILIAGQVGVNNTANFNWVWNPGNINAGTTGTTTVSPTTTTVYTVTATNPITSCTSTAQATVTVSPVAANATATPNTIVCAGSAVTLNANATGGAPFTYAWASTPAGTYAATASIIVNPTVTTTYTVTVTDACTNTTTSSVTVDVNPLPTASIQEAGPITICFPATQVLTAVTDAGTATYQWTLNNTNIPSATGATYTVSGVGTGTYRVIVTNTATGCISAPSVGVVVTINQQPSAVSISPVSATICAGSPQLLTASGGTINTTGSGVVSGTPTSTQSTTGSPYRAGAGANSQIKQQMLVRASELVAMGIPANTPTNLNSIGFTTPATASGTFVGFTISIANTAATTLTSTFLTSPGITLTTVFTAASYSPVANSINTHTFQTPFLWDGVSNIVVETRQTNSVTGTSGVITYVPAGITNPTVYSSGTSGFAALTGSTATFRPIMNFSFGATTATNFTWSPSTGLNTTSGATVTASPQTTTTYTVTATSALGCTNTAEVVITATPRPTATISGSGAFCQNAANTSTDLTLNFTGTAPWNYTYQVNAGSPVSGTTSSNPLTIAVAPSSAAAGLFTYTISALSDANCAGIDGDWTGSGTVTINPLATTPTATVLQPTCALGTGTITVTGPLGAGNSYSLDGGTAIVWPAVSFSGVAPGLHSITVTNSFGCSAAASTSVTVDPQPFLPTAPVVTGFVNVCPYIGTLQQVTYTATTTGNGTPVFNWVIPTTNVTIISGQGTASLTVTFQNGFATQANKQLRVTVTNACGTSPMTIYYLLAQLPNTPAPITGPTDACPLLGTGSATYSVPVVIDAASYIWSAQPGVIITPAGAGVLGNTVNVQFPIGFTTSAITVRSVNDCGTSGARSITVTRVTPSTPGLIAGSTNACAFIAPGGTAATYSVTQVPGVTYNWTPVPGAIGLTGQGTNTISFIYPTGFVSGSISVTASNGCGTSGPRSLSISRLNPATPSVIDVIQTAVCGAVGGRVFTYTLSALPANATSILWTVPTGAGAILVSGQGTISITVSYPDAAVAGFVTAQAINNCGVSTIRSTEVKLPACPVEPPPPPFASTNGNNNTAEGKGNTVKATLPTVSTLEVKIFPNPTVSDFKMEVLTASSEEINVRVLDNQGRFYKSFRIMPSQIIALGAELKAGSYLVEVRQGTQVKTTKVIKF